MELLQLEYFKAVAASGHVTETARRLNVTQSSVSRTLGRLEEDLGARLFDRVGRTLQLNEFGRLFLRRAEKALSELAQGRQEIADLSGLDHGFVKLAVNTAGTLPAILRLFQKKHPTTQFHVSMVTTAEMVVLLKRGEMDFGLSSSPVHDDDLDCRIVLQDPILLAVPPGHRLASFRLVGLTELKDENFIGVRSGYGARDLTDAVCRSSGFLPRYIFEGDEPARVQSLVEAGIGVAFVPGTSRSANENLVYLSLADEHLVRDIALLQCQGHYLSKAAQEFQKVVLEFFAGVSEPREPSR